MIARPGNKRKEGEENAAFGMWNRHRAQPATTSAERRATVVRDEMATLRRQLVDEDELTAGQNSEPSSISGARPEIGR
jgi:hypothetical protein